MAQAQQQLGFFQGTALRRIPGPRIRMAEGLASGINSGILPRNGYGAFIRLHLHVKIGKTGLLFRDGYTLTYPEMDGPETDDLSRPGGEAGAQGNVTVGGSVPTKQHIYRLLDNIQLTNNKALTPINASAYDLTLLANQKRYGVDVIRRNAALEEIGGNTYFHAVVDLPLSPNLGRAALWGLIGLQSNTAEWTIKLQNLDVMQIFSNVDSQTVKCQAYVDSILYYFDVPDPAAFAQPPLAYAWMLQGKTVAGGTVNSGDFYTELSPLGGTLTHLITTMHDTTGRPFEIQRGDYRPVPQGTASVERLRTVIDNTDYLQDMTALEYEAWYRDIYGKAPVPGTFVYIDGMSVLDTQIGEFIAPDFMFGFVSPDKYSSVKTVASVNLNGVQAGDVRQFSAYLQKLRTV